MVGQKTSLDKKRNPERVFGDKKRKWDVDRMQGFYSEGNKKTNAKFSFTY